VVCTAFPNGAKGELEKISEAMIALIS